MGQERCGHRPSEVISALGPIEIDSQHWSPQCSKVCDVDLQRVDQEVFPIGGEDRRRTLKDDPLPIDKDVVQLHPELTREMVVTAPGKAEALAGPGPARRIDLGKVDRVDSLEQLSHLGRGDPVVTMTARGLDLHEASVDQLAEVAAHCRGSDTTDLCKLAARVRCAG